jgi:hypothetical protein
MATFVRVSAAVALVICLLVFLATFDQPTVLAQTGGEDCEGKDCVFSIQCAMMYVCVPAPPYVCICDTMEMTCYCKAFGL